MSTKVQQIAALVQGGNFIVRAYRDSSENVSDMVLRAAGKDGYQGLVRESLSYLFKGLWKGNLPEDLEPKAEPVAEALYNAMEKSLENIGGPARAPGKSDVIHTDNVGYLQEDPESVFVLRLIRVSHLVLAKSPKTPKAKTEEAAIRALLQAQLPVENYIHRINLYPGKYMEVEAHA